MKASEKAKELVKKFKTSAIEIPLGDGTNDVINGYITFESAKQCALITVDEILDAINWHDFETPNKEIEYWNEVKTEIEKL